MDGGGARDRKSRLTILPMTMRNQQLAHTSELLASTGMNQFLESVKDTFDVIIVDLAPMIPVIDAKAFEPYVDGFVFVTEWGVTPVKAVQSVLRAEPQVAAKTIGVILNKTEMGELRKYADPGAPESLRATYHNYYKDTIDAKGNAVPSRTRNRPSNGISGYETGKGARQRPLFSCAGPV